MAASYEDRPVTVKTEIGGHPVSAMTTTVHAKTRKTNRGRCRARYRGERIRLRSDFTIGRESLLLQRLPRQPLSIPHLQLVDGIDEQVLFPTHQHLSSV